MRIIADKKDYYDCIMAMGIDRTNVFVRKSEEVVLKRHSWPFPKFYGYHGHHYIIGFCGNIYPLIEIQPPDSEDFVHVKRKGLNPPIPPSVKCFNLAECDAFMEKHLKKRELQEYQEKIRHRHRYHYWYRDNKRQHYVDFFRECEEQKTKYAKMFQEKHSPIFVACEHSKGNGVIEWNAMLNEHAFYRVFDPYTAYGELQMFMSNLAVPSKPMPVIDDVTKAESKGFDKWSFRTPPCS